MFFDIYARNFLLKIGERIRKTVKIVTKTIIKYVKMCTYDFYIMAYKNRTKILLKSLLKNPTKIFEILKIC